MEGKAGGCLPWKVFSAKFVISVVVLRPYAANTRSAICKTDKQRYMRFIKSETYFPVIIGLHAVLWAVDLSLLHDGPISLVEGESPVQRVIGEFMSSWVVTVFGFNLLMTTRMRWGERIFGGLDKMYLIHRRSGIIAAVLLLLHFGTVPRHPEFSIGKPLGFLSLALIVLGVAFAAAPVMKRKLPYHKWLNGHRMMGVFFLVGLAHAALVPSLISQLPLVRVYVIGMAVLGVVAWLYKAILFRFFKKPLPYTVTEVRRYGGAIVDIRLKPDGEQLDYKAGQFAFFVFESIAPAESHPFTIASSPDEAELRIVVKASGDFTAQLCDAIGVGERVKVEGAYGHLVQDQIMAPQQVWVAGGIGVTPFLSLARSLSETEKSAKLFWTVRGEEDAFATEELSQLAVSNAAFDFEVWSSRDRGRFTMAEVIANGAVDSVAKSDVVVCGPLALRDSIEKDLKALGNWSGDLHSEEFAFR